METKERCDIACDILQRTHDGDDLDPPDLKLVELAVNGFLNDAGYQTFRDLHRDALNGYVKPWFHGIEHLTRDHTGHVHWKGKVVEHFDSPWAYSPEAKTQAEEVARRCWLLEADNAELSVTTVIWRWPEGK